MKEATKEYYSAAELAATVSVHSSNIIRRANKENWPILKRSNRLGGNAYPYESLPDDVKAAIARQLAAAEPKRALEGAVIPDWSNKFGLARYRIVMEWRAWRQKQAKKSVGKTEATGSYLAAYNTGQLLPEVFATVGQVQKSTLYRWDNLLKEHGDDYYALCDQRGKWAKGGRKGPQLQP